MLTIDESIFFGSLSLYPELIYTYEDLDASYFSCDFANILYEQIKITDIDELKKNGFLSLALELKEKKVINSEQWHFVVDGFGVYEYQLNSYSAGLAYKNIKNLKLKDNILFKISDILKENKTIDYKQLIERFKIISEMAETSYIKTFKPETCTSILSQEKIVYKSKIRFGWNKIDDIVQIERNSLIAICARPFTGKTTLACNIAGNNAMAGLKILIISMEMKKHQIAEKLKYIQDKYLSNIFIQELTSVSIQEIKDMSMQLNPDLIIIDQFNKISSKKDKEYEVFTENARKLKILTGQLNIPIIVLCQINRTAENKRPYMWQIKGSGSIEEEADIVIIIDIEDRTLIPSLTKVYLDKNRSMYGEICDMYLGFDKQFQKYKECV